MSTPQTDDVRVIGTTDVIAPAVLVHHLPLTPAAAGTVLSTMTSMLVLYRAIGKLAMQSAESFGYAFHAGFAVVITLQVLLYGLWSGMACRAKNERDARRDEKKYSKKSKK